jgi:hypothetical protein
MADQSPRIGDAVEALRVIHSLAEEVRDGVGANDRVAWKAVAIMGLAKLHGKALDALSGNPTGFFDKV